MNYYRRYVGDYLRDTSRLSMLEHGAYNLLLDYYYAEERPIPLDMDEVYRMTRAILPEERRAIVKVLTSFFMKAHDGYRHKRVDHEIEVSQKARSNGREGGRPRTGSITGMETGLQTGTETGELTGSGHPPTTNHQPPTTSPQPPEKKARKRAAIPLPADFGISERVRLWAAGKGFSNLDGYLEFFTGRMKASGKTYVEWDEAFMNCVREDWPGLRKNGAGAQPDYSGLVARLAEEEKKNANV